MVDLKGLVEVVARALADEPNAVRVGQSKDANEPRGAALVGKVLHLLQQQRVVVGVAFACVVELCPAGAVHARLSVQRVHSQTAVIRQRPGTERLRVMRRLDARIGSECRAGLFDVRHVPVRRQIGPRETRIAQHFAKLADLALVRGGDDDVH